MLTLGIGIVCEMAVSPRSSSMFLMRSERSATFFSGGLSASLRYQSGIPGRGGGADNTY